MVGMVFCIEFKDSKGHMSRVECEMVGMVFCIEFKDSKCHMSRVQ